MKKINILHISDIHARTDRELELDIRTKALIRDIEHLKVEPDIIIVSGDLAYSGRPEEFELADKIFSKLSRGLNISAKNFMFCMGNHDIDRSKIDTMAEAGLISKISDTNLASEAFDHTSWTMPRQQNYLNYLNTRGIDTTSPSYSRVFEVSDFKVGISSFNSSWRCSGDTDKNNLFLTDPQVHALHEEIKDAELKIAIMHHPMDWYHATEQTHVQPDLYRRYDFVLTGHLHSPESSYQITPNNESLIFTVPAFFDGAISGIHDGYNFYTVDPIERSVACHHRKFIREREDFDRHVEHAKDGQSQLPLPQQAIPTLAPLHVVKKMNEAVTSLELSVREELKIAQKLDNPIIVNPPFKEVTWKREGKSENHVNDPYHNASETSSIIYGEPDSGTTIFLKELCSKVNAVRNERYALYFESQEVAGVKKPEQLLRFINNRVDEEIGESKNEVQLTIAIDNLNSSNSDFIGRFLSLAAEQKWHIVLCVKNDMLFDAIGPELSLKGIAFLRLSQWGPSRLKEFATRYLEALGKTVDVDAAIEFLENCLANSDIPVTPFLVAVYLRVFCELGNELSGLNFIRLLEKMEETGLDQAEGESAYSIYNLRLILQKLAILCYERSSLSVDKNELESIIIEFFDKKLLDSNPNKFISHLCQSGIVCEKDNYIEFTCYVFYNFYLAQSLEKGFLILKDNLTDLDSALRLGDALSYFSGRQREDQFIATQLLRYIEKEYPIENAVTVTHLEEHIKHLLEPRKNADERDDIASKAVKRRKDLKAADKDFEERRAEHREVSESLMGYKTPSTDIEKIIRHVLALRSLYNVVRNAEHIDGPDKLVILSKVIDHHVHCNMSLITLHAKALASEELHSLSAYLITLGGSSFLTEHLGAESLKRAILKLLETETDPLKRFLLISLYADLRLPNYIKMFESFITEATNVCLIEMSYAKANDLLIKYEQEKLPTQLIGLFNTAFDKRQSLTSKLTTISYSQKDIKPKDTLQARDAALNHAKKMHFRYRELKKMQ
ncbi:hypothetical protein DDZ13_03855 [Coraliomargarita sinensis]|uniref:Uncharacterized protein n=1 Tax=Coraliomargarita sinensis TaxID=2174842 RepID=A0A317ZLQ7_9BACT|nr:metallophosphoesterase [Coraliomargarita sinensis]PXA05107.1 hypothetical protein DDZ13_03855 [Coraliomargarita sinensis]